MNDIRVIGALVLAAIAAVGLLAAKAFGFSIAWVLWPVGVLALLLALASLILGAWAP